MKIASCGSIGMNTGETLERLQRWSDEAMGDGVIPMLSRDESETGTETHPLVGGAVRLGYRPHSPSLREESAHSAHDTLAAGRTVVERLRALFARDEVAAGQEGDSAGRQVHLAAGPAHLPLLQPLVLPGQLPQPVLGCPLGAGGLLRRGAGHGLGLL